MADGTDESTEVLLAEGYEMTPAMPEISIEWCASVDQCAELLNDWDNPGVWQRPLRGRSKSMLMGKSCGQLIAKIQKEPHCQRLGDFARISIGIVTGANRYFVLDKADVAVTQLGSKCFRQVLSKFGMTRGVRLTRDDLLDAADGGARCHLLHTDGHETEDRMKDYLAKFPKELLASNRTFKKRAVWHQPDDGQIPDGFFPYMNHVGPRIVLNDARVTSTNTVHRVFFEPLLNSDYRKLVVISLMSTFSYLSAEVEGRTYGSGVLKFEPTEARNIKLLIPPDVRKETIHSVYDTIDLALRSGNATKANSYADDFLQSELPDLYTSERRGILEAALQELRSRRHSKAQTAGSSPERSAEQ